MIGVKTLLFVLSLPVRRAVRVVIGPLLVLGSKALTLTTLAGLVLYLFVSERVDTVRHRSRTLR